MIVALHHEVRGVVVNPDEAVGDLLQELQQVFGTFGTRLGGEVDPYLCPVFRDLRHSFEAGLPSGVVLVLGEGTYVGRDYVRAEVQGQVHTGLRLRYKLPVELRVREAPSVVRAQGAYDETTVLHELAEFPPFGGGHVLGGRLPG